MTGCPCRSPAGRASTWRCPPAWPARSATGRCGPAHGAATARRARRCPPGCRGYACLRTALTSFAPSCTVFGLTNRTIVFIILNMRTLWRTSLAAWPRDAALLRDVGLVGLADGIVGVSFGAASVAGGLPWWVPVALSVLVFAGGSQIAAVGVVLAGGSPLAAVAAGAVLNTRLFPYGLAVADVVTSEYGAVRRWLDPRHRHAPDHRRVGRVRAAPGRPLPAARGVLDLRHRAVRHMERLRAAWRGPRLGAARHQRVRARLHVPRGHARARAADADLTVDQGRRGDRGGDRGRAHPGAACRAAAARRARRLDALGGWRACRAASAGDGGGSGAAAGDGE